MKVKVVKAWFSKNQPALMIASGLAGLVTTVILAVRGQKKADAIISEDRMNAEPDDPEIYYRRKKDGKLRVRMKYRIKRTWKCYIPTFLVGGMSIGCVIASHRVSERRNALLASSLAASEAAMTEYQKQVVDAIGEDAEKAIHQKFAEKQVENEKIDPPLIDTNTYVNCIESSTNQHFLSTKQDIRKVENDLNQERLTGFGSIVTLNDYYSALGVEETEIGYMMGWDIDNPVSITITTIEKNGIPCLYVHPMNMVAFKNM